MNVGDPITIPTGLKIKHAHVIGRAGDLFRVAYGRPSSVSTRTLIITDEGRRWMPGHLIVGSPEAKALSAATALVGESPWKDGTAGPIGSDQMWELNDACIKRTEPKR